MKMIGRRKKERVDLGYAGTCLVLKDDSGQRGLKLQGVSDIKTTDL